MTKRVHFMDPIEHVRVFATEDDVEDLIKQYRPVYRPEPSRLQRFLERHGLDKPHVLTILDRLGGEEVNDLGLLRPEEIREICDGLKPLQGRKFEILCHMATK